MHREVDRLSVWLPVAIVREHPGWQRYHAMPVVDDEDRLVGAIRYQMLRKLEREAPGHGADPARSRRGRSRKSSSSAPPGSSPPSQERRPPAARTAPSVPGTRCRMRDESPAGFAELARTFIREFPGEASRRLDELPAHEIARVLGPSRHDTPFR
jgi:hypothetical protein